MLLGGLEDAVASFRWVDEHADELFENTDRLAVAGDSAGATLASVACQH